MSMIGTAGFTLGVARLALGLARLRPGADAAGSPEQLSTLDRLIAVRQHGTRVFALSLIVLIPALVFSARYSSFAELVTGYDLAGVCFLFVAAAAGRALTDMQLRSFRRRIDGANA